MRKKRIVFVDQQRQHSKPKLWWHSIDREATEWHIKAHHEQTLCSEASSIANSARMGRSSLEAGCHFLATSPTRHRGATFGNVLRCHSNALLVRDDELAFQRSWPPPKGALGPFCGTDIF
ncbi:hypothetical protein BU17DRAFT_60094 [Hysterangium stoloniferum]|nr:hypothetical protein BU17DRAFT_60094 [Hysterangium stoloniferum]